MFLILLLEERTRSIITGQIKHCWKTQCVCFLISQFCASWIRRKCLKKILILYIYTRTFVQKCVNQPAATIKSSAPQHTRSLRLLTGHFEPYGPPWAWIPNRALIGWRRWRGVMMFSSGSRWRVKVNACQCSLQKARVSVMSEPLSFTRKVVLVTGAGGGELKRQYSHSISVN